MSKQFEFADFVEEFKVPFIAYEKREGYWADNADWVPVGQLVPINLIGIVLPLTEDDLQYSESGSHSVKDRKVYTTHKLEMGQRIQYKGITYTIQNFKDYSDYADVNIYFARWAGNESQSS